MYNLYYLYATIYLFTVFYRIYNFLEESERGRKGSNDNPFSFKRFLQSNSGNRQPTGPHQQQQPAAGNGLLATLDLANDLPDFVHYQHHHQQSHHGGDAQSPDGGGRNQSNDFRGGARAPAELAILPDFALDSAAATAASNHGASGSAGSDPGVSSYQFPPPAASASPGAAPFLYPPGGLPPPDIESLDARLVGGGASASQLGSGRSTNHSGARSGLDEDEAMAVADSPVSDRANSAGGLPDFLSDSAIGGILNVASRLAGGGDVGGVRAPGGAMRTDLGIRRWTMIAMRILMGQTCEGYAAELSYRYFICFYF